MVIERWTEREMDREGPAAAAAAEPRSRQLVDDSLAVKDRRNSIARTPKAWRSSGSSREADKCPAPPGRTSTTALYQGARSRRCGSTKHEDALALDIALGHHAHRDAADEPEGGVVREDPVDMCDTTKCQQTC